MSTKRKTKLHSGKFGAAITVQLFPGSIDNRIIGLLPDGTIKIHLNTKGDKSSVNETLIHYLCEILDVQKKQVDIIGGENLNEKLISIIGLNAESVEKIILRHVNQKSP
jgi:uncharacterized protein YggU (UPF0235/DUF167 family)